jgi:hypothetical protein
MCLVRCELGFYIPEDSILHGHHSKNLKSYVVSLVLIPKFDIRSSFIPLFLKRVPIR